MGQPAPSHHPRPVPVPIAVAPLAPNSAVRPKKPLLENPVDEKKSIGNSKPPVSEETPVDQNASPTAEGSPGGNPRRRPLGRGHLIGDSYNVRNENENENENI